jgi:hypothetical protein
MEQEKSAAPSYNISDSDTVKPEIPASDADTGLPEPLPSGVEPRSASGDAHDGEGSVGYRIAAMFAMFLLALVAIVIWYYGH